MSDIQVINVHKDPRAVDIVAEGVAFTFWYENGKLRCNRRMESGAQNYDFSFVQKPVFAAVRRRAVAILKSS